MSESVAVTGLGFVCPLGTGREAVWEAWTAGTSGVRRLAEGDPRLARGVDPIALPEVGRAGFVRDFQPKKHIRSSHLRRMDWCSRMIVACATQAATDADLPLGDGADRVRTGLVVGSCFGNQRETQRYMDRVFRNGPGAGQPILFPNLVLNAAGGYAAIELSIQGPNLTVSEHEASGEVAVAAAVELLDSGMCDRVVVGGADEISSVYLGALRDRRLLDGGSSPAAARPDASRGRLVPGEGAAALVLERTAEARQRGRIPYATVAAPHCPAVPAGPYEAPQPGEAAEHLCDAVEPAPVGAVIGGANGTRPREELDRSLLEALSRRHAGTAGYLRLDGLVGDWPSRGTLSVALAALAIHAGALPGLPPGNGASLERILVPGSGRSGVLVPVVVGAERAAPGD